MPEVTQQSLMSRLHEIPAMIFVCSTGTPPGPAIPDQVAFYGSILPSAWSLMLALLSRQLTFWNQWDNDQPQN